MNPCLTESDLDRYHANEMEGAEEALVRKHLAACPDCTRRDSTLVDANEELLGRVQALGPMPSDKKVVGNGSHGAMVEESRELPTELVSGYRLVREIHRGGQGIVYEAVQESTKQTVALKVLLEGRYASSANRRRFEREIELVASMKHPNIVTVYDSGTTTDGRQYCVMDYVAGLPLDEHLRRNVSSVEQVLGAFLAVCEAVHYAHQRGVIHRDLKPSNILVDGVPKVLDFGLAKNIDATEGTLLSLTGQVLGTLPYLSPEQASGIPDAVDVRTDVYALGVILYELLTGQYPYPVVGQIVEILRHISETPPTPPIRQWTSHEGVTRRERRRVRVGQCPIDDDLQTIVLKSLSKECERRYQSAGDLARDVSHYLAGEPIDAKRDSGWYILKTTIRRHKIPVAVAAGFVILLAAFAATVSVMYAEQSGLLAEVQHERNRAVAAEALAENRLAESQRQANIARAVSDFLSNDLLAAADPENTPDREITVREVLDGASEEIEGKFTDESLIEASIRTTLGMTYKSLGEYEVAEQHLVEALALRRAEIGDEHADTLTALGNLAMLYDDQGRYDEAEPLCIKVLEGRLLVQGSEHADTLNAMSDLATVYWNRGEYARAEPLYVDALEIQRRTSGEEDPLTLILKSNLANLYLYRGEYAKAEPLSKEVMNSQRKVLGEEHPATLKATNNLAVLYAYQKQYEEAEPLWTRVLEVRYRTLGEAHPATLRAMSNMAALNKIMGRFDKAESLMIQAAGIQERVLGEEHPDTLTTLNNLAHLYDAQERYADAEPLCRRVLQIRRRTLGDDHPETLTSITNLASIFRHLERYEQSQPLFEEALDGRRRILGQDHRETHEAMSNLATVYLQTNQYPKAEPLLRNLVAAAKRSPPEGDGEGKGLILTDYGNCLAALRRYEEAQAALLEAHQILVDSVGAKHDHTTATTKSLIELYVGWGKPEEADRWRNTLSSSRAE